MAVNSMATIAIRIVVTTCPPAALFTMPYSPIGAIGWMITMPMMIKFHNVSERFRRGPEFELVSLLKHLSFLQRSYSSNPAAHAPVKRAGLRPPTARCITSLFVFIQSFQYRQFERFSCSAQYQK